MNFQNKTIDEIKKFYFDQIEQNMLNTIFSQFKENGLTVETFNNPDWQNIILVEGVPLHLNIFANTRIGNNITVIEESKWHDTLSISKEDQKILVYYTEFMPKYTLVDKLSNDIKKFRNENPTYGNMKLRPLNRIGVLEHLQTFENWKKSDKLVSTNNKTGLFEEESDKEGEEWIDDCLIKHQEETAEIVADHGTLKVGVIYDDQGVPHEDAIMIETLDTAPDGYVTIHVSELRKLLNTATKYLDNFPKI